MSNTHELLQGATLSPQEQATIGKALSQFDAWAPDLRMACIAGYMLGLMVERASSTQEDGDER